MNIASDYIAHGMALVPIPKGKKGPKAKGWQKRENVITDPEQASQWVGNIGLAHAYSTPQTMALDIDDLPKARVWLANKGVDLDALLEADDGVQIASGRAGRAKLIYRLPPGLGSSQTKKITDPVTDEMVIEFRSSTANDLTMQDVLPPSIHPDTGKPYEWAGKGNWQNLPQIPMPLLDVWQDIITGESRRTNGRGCMRLFKSVEDTPRQRARVADMLNYITADCSYERYRDIVWAILSLGWSDGEKIAEQWCQTAPECFEEGSFWTVVNSYDETRTPTIGTIHYHAKLGGWHG